MKKYLKYFLILIITFFLISTSPIIISGYNQYKTVMLNNDLNAIVMNLKAKPDYVTLDKISKEYIAQLLISEDKRFYYHFGFDLIAFTRAIITNISEGRYVEGGSTITQQLAKNLFFSFDKTLDRKVAELLVAFYLESKLSKNEILELYVNIIFFGNDCYGIKEATNLYYNEEPDNLSVDKIKVLVQTIKNPTYYNPLIVKLSE